MVAPDALEAEEQEEMVWTDGWRGPQVRVN